MGGPIYGFKLWIYGYSVTPTVPPRYSEESKVLIESKVLDTIMSSIIHFILIHNLFFFLQYLILNIGVNFQTPSPSIANHDHSGVHLLSQYSTHSAPKQRKLAFGLVNTIANGVIIVITILNIVVYKLREIHEANLREKYTPSEQLCRQFLLADILLATKNFDESLVVGQGGFGKVYKGAIDNGMVTVAIKRLNPMSKQGAPEFLAEIELLSKVRHSNIVSLIGYCDDCDEMILVYEYMVRGTLADNMHRNSNKSALPWAQRIKICIGAARGLDYLHTGTSDHNRIIHRDVKSPNILLGENWTAKISDFGMAKIGPTNQLHTHVSTNVKGTFGYMDPEYYLTHQLTRKSDVYAFGVVLFEVLCGRRAVDLRLDEEQRGLAGWAQECIKEGKLDQIVNPILRGQILSDSLTEFARIADQCLHMFSTKRPTMAEVVVALELALTLQERKDFSIFEEEFFNTGGGFDNQENVDSSIKEGEVINGKIEGIMQLDSASSEDSHVKPARIMAFTKTVQQFFFGTARSDARATKNYKSNNNDGVNMTVSSKDREVVQQVVPPSGHVGDPNFKMFTFAQLRAATGNFKTERVVNEGRFGKVFKCWLDEKTYEPSSVGMRMPIAVKKIKLTYPEIREFKSKVEFWGKFSHPNLLKILGYCLEDSGFYLVQQYMRKGSLENHLFRNSRKPLTWVTRLKIAVEAARGLAFLHTSEKKVSYYQFKTSNILLDGDFNARLSDFELTGLERESNNLDSLVTRVLMRNPENNAYAYAHAAPEYKVFGQFSLKSDVYSFGVVLLEILTGQRALVRNQPLESRYLVDWCRPFPIDKRRLKTVMDPHLEGQYSPKCAVEYAALVGKCVGSNAKSRPSIEVVLKTLEHINAIEMKP
ncbi:hypothetical protein LguiA_030855 [Lonicera macranthoides]